MRYYLIGIVLGTFLLTGCDTKEVSTEITPVTSTPLPAQAPVPEPSKEEVLEREITQALTPAQEEVAKRLEETNKELSDRLAQTAQEGAEKLEETLKETSAALDTAPVPAKATLCASCHGTKGEKAALGRSAIMSEMSVAQIQEALLGYQKGTFGGAMKAMMETQVKGMSAEEIEALARFYGK